MPYGLPYENLKENNAKTNGYGGAGSGGNTSAPRRNETDYSRRAGHAPMPSRNYVSGQKKAARGTVGYSASGAPEKTAARAAAPGTGEIKRRAVSRVPNMNNARKKAKRTPTSSSANAVPVAGLHIEPKIKTVKDKKKKPLHIPAFIAGGLCTALFMYMLTNFVMINEYTKDITGLRNELSDLTEQQRKLALQLEMRNDLRVIDELAAKLGMVKVDQVSKQYVIVESEDKIEILNGSR